MKFTTIALSCLAATFAHAEQAEGEVNLDQAVEKPVLEPEIIECDFDYVPDTPVEN